MRKLYILLIILFSSVTVFAENFINNSSFELGRAEFGIHRFIRTGKEREFTEPVFDTADKIHGKQSIRFDNPDADAIEFFSREYKLVPGKTYTFSFYMKSSKPINMMVRQYAGEMIDLKSGDWNMGTTRYYIVGQTWKRYTFSFKAKGRKSWYFTQYRWGNIDDKANAATVWFDALQVTEGDKVLAYAPKAPVEAALFGDQRVMAKGKKIPCELRVVNYTGKTTELNTELTVENTMFPEKEIPARKVTVRVPAGKVVTKNINTEMGCFGHFKLAGTYSTTGKKYQLGSWFFAEIPEVDTTTQYNLKKHSVTGVSSNIGRSAYRDKSQIKNSYLTMNGCGESSYGEFLRNTGMKLLRIHGGGFRWKNQEPSPGKFDWDDSDEMLNFADKYGMKLMPLLGNMFYVKKRQGNEVNFSSIPLWLLESPKTQIHKMRGSWDGVSPDPAAWERYVTALTSRYKGRIPAYEITNEPNIVLPSAKEYIPYVISSGKIIKKIDPAAAVIGGSITTDLGGKTDAFLNEMGKSGSLEYCDAVSFHPYDSPLAGSPNSAQSNIKRLRGITDQYSRKISLWNTELYYIGPAPSANYAIATPATHAQHLLRRLLIDMGENVKQSMTINDAQLMINELIPHWELGDGISYNGYVPHDLYVGMSIASSLLNGTVPVKTFSWPSGACGYIYKKSNGQKFAAVWNASDKQKFMINLPDKNLKIYDMFMNPLKANEKMLLTDYPVFIFGEGLENLELETEQSVKTGMAFFSLENGKKVLNLEVINTAAGEMEFAVRPDFIAKPQFIKLGINENGFVKFRDFKDFNPAKAKLYISDNKKNFTFQFPELIKKICLADQTVKSENYAFKTSADVKGFHLDIKVSDKERGIRKKGAPWTGDSVELFFDSCPLKDVSNVYYSQKDNSRLFIAPKSRNGLPEHKSSMNMDMKNVDIAIKESADGYSVNVFIPWLELNMKYGDVLGFDLKLNDMDKDGKQKYVVWSGSDSNHRFRDRYGLCYLK